MNNVYVWGTGADLDKVLLAAKKKFNVLGLIDKDIDKIGEKIYNLDVLSPEDIITDKEQIIIGSRKYSEVIILEAIGMGITSDRLIKIEYHIYDEIVWQYNRLLKSYFGDIINFIDMFNNKRIVIYGSYEKSKEWITLFDKLGINFGYFVLDDHDEINKIDDANYSYIEDKELLYYEDYEKLMIMVFADKRNQVIVSKLMEMGIPKEIIYEINTKQSIGAQERNIYDVEVGWSRNNELPGIKVFGEHKKGLKVLILGGSTSDYSWSNLKSWPEYLYEFISGMGIDVTIYNAGMAALTVSGEFLKLVRDGIYLKPDIVISYSGVNNMNQYFFNNGTFFTSDSQVDMIRKGIPDNKEVGFGIVSDQSLGQLWSQLERMMWAICNEYGIFFRGILQPCAAYDYIKRGRKVIFNYTEEQYKQTIEFYKEVRMDIKDKHYMLDFSSIFEGNENLYMDHCHVYEYGNKIIARKVMKIILENLNRNEVS